MAAVAVLLAAGGGLGVGAACAPSRSVESFCGQLKAVEGLDEVLAAGSGARAGEQAAELHRLRLVAPDEVEAQVARLAAVTDDLATTMGTAPDADAAAGEVFARRQAELPEITAAGRAVEAFAAQQCQVVLNPTATAPPTSAGPPPTTAAPTTVTTTTRPPSSTTSRKPTTTRRASPAPTTRSTRAPATTKAPTTTRRRITTTTTRRR